MNFIKHENFPDAIANLIRHFEFWSVGEPTLLFPQELYGEGVLPHEWFQCVGKVAIQHRPAIVTLDDGVKSNALGLKAMKDCGCIFVVFSKGWADNTPFHEFAWRALRYWPEVVARSVAAYRATKQCKIEVSKTGKLSVLNF